MRADGMILSRTLMMWILLDERNDGDLLIWDNESTRIFCLSAVSTITMLAAKARERLFLMLRVVVIETVVCFCVLNLHDT